MKLEVGEQSGLVGHVVATERPIFIADNADLDSRVLVKEDMESFIGIPLHAEDELLGAITMSTRRGKNRLTEQDRDLVATIVSQASLVIRNARRLDYYAGFETAIEQVADVITITDTSGVMRYVNPAFERVTGYSTEEAIGAKPSILSSGKHGPEHYRELWETLTNGEVWIGRFVNRHKDGTLWEAESTIAPVRNREDEIDGFVEVKRDISEQVELQNQLRQAQKMEALGRLAGGIAHDFNNLLTVIRGYSDLLMDETDGSGSTRVGLRAIKRAASRAADLTRRLLVFSKDQPVETITLSVDDAVRGVEPMLGRLISEAVELELHLDSAPWTIEIDPGQLEQVIINLVVNACDSMPDGGQLMIETRRSGGSSSESAASTELVELCLRDSGTGMDAETVEHIFDPFFTTKERGTGLGLSIVHGIVTQSGGRIDVSSVLGSGSSFTVVWPRSTADVSEPQKIPESVVVRGTETVLVVDDDVGVREFIMASLERHGYSVAGTRTSAEALEIFSGLSDGVDLLVTDVVLPGMSGPDLAEHLLKTNPKLRVLFVTGYLSRYRDHPALERFRVLRKPFQSDVLLSDVRKALDDTP